MENKENIKNYKPIIFLHIPKSAGTSLCDYLGQFYADEENYFKCCFKYGTKQDRYDNVTFINYFNEIASKYKFISGHFNFELAEQLSNYFKGKYSDHAMVTFLREPALRVISQYNFLVKINYYTDGGIAKYGHLPESIYNLFTIKKISFEEFIEIYDNLQTKTFSSKNPMWYLSQDKANKGDLELAKLNLRKFNVIGIYEELETSINILSKNMLYNNTTFPKSNITEKIKFKYEPPQYMQNIKFESLSNSTRNKLMLLNELDYELYYYARNIFNMTKQGDYSWRL